MHWADAMAQRLADISDHHIIATGITPSGPIHVGNMREVLTAELVHRACQDIGIDAELIYVADDADPLRKVYPFLDQDTYAPYVGHMLAEIPAPEGSGTYAEHFLAPFLAALKELDIHPRVVNNRQSYLNGLHHDATVLHSLRRCHGRPTIRPKTAVTDAVSGTRSDTSSRSLWHLVYVKPTASRRVWLARPPQTDSPTAPPTTNHCITDGGLLLPRRR